MTNPATQIFLGSSITPIIPGKYFRPEFLGKELEWLNVDSLLLSGWAKISDDPVNEPAGNYHGLHPYGSALRKTYMYAEEITSLNNVSGTPQNLSMENWTGSVPDWYTYNPGWNSKWKEETIIKDGTYGFGGEDIDGGAEPFLRTQLRDSVLPLAGRVVTWTLWQRANALTNLAFMMTELGEDQKLAHYNGLAANTWFNFYVTKLMTALCGTTGHEIELWPFRHSADAFTGYYYGDAGHMYANKVTAGYPGESSGDFKLTSDGIDLTERASITLVEANNNSYYLDPVNHAVYLNVNNGDNPAFHIIRWVQTTTVDGIIDPSLVISGTTPAEIFAVGIRGTAAGELYYFKTNISGTSLITSGVLDSSATCFKPVLRKDSDGNFHVLYFRGANVAWIKFDSDFNILDSDTSLLTHAGEYKIDFDWLGSDFKLVISHTSGVAGYTMTKAGVTTPKWTLLNFEDGALAVDTTNSKIYLTCIDRNSNPLEQNKMQIRRLNSSFNPETSFYTKKKFSPATDYYYIDSYFKDDHLIFAWEQTPDVNDKITVAFYYLPENLYYEWDGWINESYALARPALAFDATNERMVLAGDIAGSYFGFLYFFSLIKLSQNMLNSVKTGWCKIEITPIGGSKENVTSDCLSINIQKEISDITGSASITLKDIDKANVYATKYKKGDLLEITLGRDSTYAIKKFAGYIIGITGSLNANIQDIPIEADDFSSICLDKLVAEAFDKDDTSPAHNGYPSEIFKHLVSTKLTGFTTNNVIDSFQVLDYIAWNYVRLFDCFKELAEFAGYEWYIDENKDFHFFPPEVERDWSVFVTTRIPFANIKRGTANFYKDFSQIKNRIYLLGGQTISASKNTYKLKAQFDRDGAEFFKLPHRPYFNPSQIEKVSGVFTGKIINSDIVVKVNGSGKTVALEGSSKGFIGSSGNPPDVESIINPEDQVLKFTYNATQEPPEDATIEVIFKIWIPVIDRMDDIKSQEYFGGGIGGDSNIGIKEDVLILPDVDDRRILRRKGRRVLREFAFPRWRGSCQVYEDRFSPGKCYKVDIPEKNIEIWMKAKTISYEFDFSTLSYRTSVTFEEELNAEID